VSVQLVLSYANLCRASTLRGAGLRFVRAPNKLLWLVFACLQHLLFGNDLSSRLELAVLSASLLNHNLLFTVHFVQLQLWMLPDDHLLAVDIL
jgi:hypothetical protein